jgi:hypothetical protein
MFTRLLPAALVGLSLALPVRAQEAPTPDMLYDAMRLSEVIGVMRDEGLAYGDELASGLFPGGTPSDWDDTLAAIYDPVRMEREVRENFADALTGVDLAPMLAFFTSEPGQTFLTLEISARAALIDDAVEQMAKENAAVAMADESPRFQLVRDYVEANDLIESNVVAAMNSNVAFYLGLLHGGALGGDLTEDQVLSNVWAQEPETRANTTEWVYSFLLMAYDPVSDADLQAYVAFSETDAGRALNRALFAGFEPTFQSISTQLGLAAAQGMATSEL